MSVSSSGPEGMILGGRYRIARLLGSGGMANVYLAFDMTSGIQVAIKILKPEYTADEEFIKRFDTEAKSAALLSHPNIVRVLGVGQEGELRYMVQEYVEGITVKELITQNGHLDWRVAVPIAIQVGIALDHAHQNGIVHRDIKPHNILITRDRIAKVTDFGIARAASSNTITLTSGGALGSVHYFSPEQARGAMVGPSTDIYSLGVLLFEMVTGRVPFDGETPVAIAIKHLQETPPLASSFVPGLPAGLDAIIRKSMQKPIDLRYITVHDMVSELDALMVDPNGSYGVISRQDIYEAPTGQVQSMRSDPNYGKLRDIEHSIEKRRRSRTKDNVLVILLITVILGVLLGTVYLVTKMVTDSLSNSKEQSYTIENYVGSPITEVQSKLDAASVTYTITTQVSTEYDPGIVIHQSLSPGVVIKPGNGLHTLELVVSVSEESITIPDYAGMDQQTVNDELTLKGVAVSVRAEDSSTIDKGMVVRTEPAAGGTIRPGETIILYVSSGVSTVNIPDLKTLSLTAAKATLQQNSLLLGTVTVLPSATGLSEDQQYVISSDPAAGTPVNPKSGVNLIVGTAEDSINSQFGITPTPTPAPYTLTVMSAEGGSSSGGGTFNEGTSVTVSATPSAGYHFTSWLDENSAVVSVNATYTFTMPSRNYRLTPVFSKESYTVTIMAPDQGSSFATMTGAGSYTVGTTVTVVTSIPSNYTFVGWKDAGGNLITASASYSFSMPAEDVVLKPYFAAASPTATP